MIFRTTKQLWEDIQENKQCKHTLKTACLDARMYFQRKTNYCPQKDLEAIPHPKDFHTILMSRVATPQRSEDMAQLNPFTGLLVERNRTTGTHRHVASRRWTPALLSCLCKDINNNNNPHLSHLCRRPQWLLGCASFIDDMLSWLVLKHWRFCFSPVHWIEEGKQKEASVLQNPIFDISKIILHASKTCLCHLYTHRLRQAHWNREGEGQREADAGRLRQTVTERHRHTEAEWSW